MRGCLSFRRKTQNPHYHVLVDHFIDKKWLSQTWWKIVGSGLGKALRAGTRVKRIRNQERCADYMARYLSKMDQKRIPEGFMNVGRWWGMSRGLLELYLKRTTRKYSDSNKAKAATRLVRKARSSFCGTSTE